MQAVTVTTSRELEIREVPTPQEAPSGHLLIQIEAAAINHGDKAFLKMPATPTRLNTSKEAIWGASAAGRVLAAGAGIPADYAGKKVAIYRSLTPSDQTVGLWSERAVVPVTSCLLLPEELPSAAYSGSLVNVMTAHAFIEEATSEGHTGVVVTVGRSATGLALAALARLKGISVLFLVRSTPAAEALRALGFEHVLVTSDAGFETSFGQLAAQLKATAVFDGAGGDLISRIAPHLPRNATVWLYGFLAGATPIAIPSATFMAKNLTLKPFSNFDSATVRDTTKLQHALDYLHGHIADPLFQTTTGRTFRLSQIAEAMTYETEPGAKAVLLPHLK